MMAMPSFMMILVVLLGGGGNDLLDYMPTEDYWKTKDVELTPEAMIDQLAPAKVGDVSALIKQLGADKSEDRDAASRKLLAMGPGVIPQLKPALKSEDLEVVSRAEKIIADLSGAGQAQAVRRLMAIRALGDLKDKKALPVLKHLAKGEALFEAEYAAAAIASVEGKPCTRPVVTTKAMASDLWLMPKSVGLTAQATLPAGGKPITGKELTEAITTMGGQGGGGGNAPDPEAAATMARQMSKQVVGMLIQVAEQVGNVRLHGATMALAGKVDNDTGFVTFAIRGKYDPAAIKALLIKEGTKVEKAGDLEIYRPDREFGMVMPSSDRLLIVGGPRKNTDEVKSIITAMASGKGGLKENADMVKLIKTVGEGNQAWCVTRMTDAYRKEAKILKAFNTLTGTIRQKDNQMDLVIKAFGGDAEGAAAAVQEVETSLAEGREQFARIAERMPMMKPMSDLLKSIKVASDGGNATLTGHLKGDFRKMLMAPFGMFMGVSHSVREGPGGVQVENARPQPVPR